MVSEFDSETKLLAINNKLELNTSQSPSPLFILLAISSYPSQKEIVPVLKRHLLQTVIAKTFRFVFVVVVVVVVVVVAFHLASVVYTCM